MQTRSSDEISVCLSVCPSVRLYVCQMRDLWHLSYLSISVWVSKNNFIFCLTLFIVVFYLTQTLLLVIYVNRMWKWTVSGRYLCSLKDSYRRDLSLRSWSERLVDVFEYCSKDFAAAQVTKERRSRTPGSCQNPVSSDPGAVLMPAVAVYSSWWLVRQTSKTRASYDTRHGTGHSPGSDGEVRVYIASA